MITIQTGTISRCHKYLDSIEKITPQSVQDLPQEVKEFLRSVSPARLQELAKMDCFASEKIKTRLDKKYGKNNYIIIAVGRSLSSLAETMAQMGVDTKIIPLSGLRRRDVNNISIEDLHTYKTFLSQIGLSKTDLRKNKDKKYILIDYTYYGRSLEQAEKLLRKKELLGDAENLTAIPVKNILGKDYEKRCFETLFMYSRFKDYSYVGKLHIDKLKDVYQKCSPERMKELQGNITQGLRKLFWFNVFDSLNENNYGRIMPIEELCALKKHFLSYQAVKNLINRQSRIIEKI